MALTVFAGAPDETLPFVDGITVQEYNFLQGQPLRPPLLSLHLGGEARRGQLTDQFISEFLPSSQMAIIVKSGNFDGLFSKICEENNIPLIEVEKTVDVLAPLKETFK